MPAHSFPLWPAPFCNGEADDLTFPEGLLLRLVPLGLGDGGLGLSGRPRLGARPRTVLGTLFLCPSMHCRV